MQTTEDVNNANSAEDGIELRSEEFQEVLGSVPPWILRRGVGFLALIVLLLLIGSALIKYPDAISSGIVLTGENPPAVVVARSSGKIDELHVGDRQEVKVGDYLAVIDNPARTDDVLTLRRYVENLDLEQSSPPALPDKDLQVGALQSLFADFYITLYEYREYRRLLYYPQKTAMTEKRIAQYENQYENLKRQQKLALEQFALAKSQYRRDSLLYLNNVVSNEEFEKSKTQYLQSSLSVENMQSSLDNMLIQIAQLKETLLDANQQDVEKFNGLYTRLLSLVSQLKTEIEVWELAYVLKAPVAGTITFTDYWTANQNVSAGSEVFNVIPSGDLRVIGKAMLPVARSGKVKTGQRVNIRLENFPENEYGILRGIVGNISLVPAKNENTVYYTLEIELPDKLVTTYNKELPFLPNMQGQADVVTEDISVLERFILPVKKILKENF